MIPDPLSQQYFQTWTDDLFYDDQSIYRLLLDFTKGFIHGDVLDLGCGSRVYYDTSAVNRWTGIDLSSHLLGQVVFLGGHPPIGPVETIQGDCRSLALPDESYDFVCAVFLLHHLSSHNRRRSRATITQVMREAQRVLRPGGTFVVLESWPHLLLHIYALLYAPLYALARGLFRVELPLFFRASAFAAMAADAGFGRRHILAIPIYETAKYPVGGITVPGWFEWFTHKYGLYLYRKAGVPPIS